MSLKPSPSFNHRKYQVLADLETKLRAKTPHWAAKDWTDEGLELNRVSGLEKLVHQCFGFDKTKLQMVYVASTLNSTVHVYLVHNGTLRHIDFRVSAIYTIHAGELLWLAEQIEIILAGP